MRRFILLLAILLLTAVFCPADEPALVRLTQGQTLAPDGFRVRVEVGPLALVSPHGHPFEMLYFTLSVPRRVGKTKLSGCQLMTQDNRDRTLLSVPLSISDGTSKDLAAVRVMVQREYVKGHELRFQYVAPPFDNLVTSYVFPIEEHLPAKP